MSGYIVDEERLELLEEVKAGEARERVAGSALVLLQALLINAEDEVLELRKQLAARRAFVSAQMAWRDEQNRRLFRRNDELRAVVDELRADLAECQDKRTVGGTHRGYTPDWSPNPSPALTAKFAGERPPPYAPAADRSGSALGLPELNRFSCGCQIEGKPWCDVHEGGLL